MILLKIYRGLEEKAPYGLEKEFSLVGSNVQLQSREAADIVNKMIASNDESRAEVFTELLSYINKF